MREHPYSIPLEIACIACGRPYNTIPFNRHTVETIVRILFFSDVHIEIRAEGSHEPWTKVYPLDLGPDLSAFRGNVDLARLLSAQPGYPGERTGWSGPGILEI
jgi:hypothetical protein